MLRSTTRSGRAALRLFAAAQALAPDEFPRRRRSGRGRCRGAERRSDPGLAPTAPFADLTCTTLTALPVSANTGEKPQSKIWTHGGAWWAVLPTTSASPGSGTWLWKLNGTAWTSVLKLSNATDSHADVLDTGTVTHILLYSGTSSELVSVQYGSGTYALWSGRAGSAAITLDSGVETATIAVDSAGRMWLASDASTTINVRWSDSPYSTWSAPITLGSGVTTDDISVVTAMPGGKVGVLWSNQATKRFGFKIHVDGAAAGTWGADELPASQSADDSLPAANGMADDHMNVAVASDGTLYAAVKTSYDTSGYPKMALLVRRPAGTWDPLYSVSGTGTRGILLLNEPAAELLFVYTSTEGSGNIVYRTSSTSAINFGSEQTLMAGAYNEATSTKQNYTDDLVIAASSGTTSAVGRHCVGSGGSNAAPAAPTLNAPANAGTGISTSPTLSIGVSDPDADPLTVTFFGRPFASGNFTQIGQNTAVPSGSTSTKAWASLGAGQKFEWYATVSDGTLTTTGPTWTFTTVASADPVFVGAGDIADCTRTQDTATAAVIGGVAGNVWTAGDNVYPTGVDLANYTELLRARMGWRDQSPYSPGSGQP